MDDEKQSVIEDGEEENSEEETLAPEEEEGTESEESQDSEEEESESESSQGEDETETTDRGTKKAAEPESQFYQTLKNQNADMRRILSDPASLKEYLSLMEGKQTSGEGSKDDFADLEEKVLTPDGQVDLRKLAQYMDTRTVAKIDQGIKWGVENRLKQERIGNQYRTDLSGVREAHPELDPKSKGFNKELDHLIGERFIAQGGMEGKVTIREVIDQTYKDLEVFSNKGRREANTEIIKRKAGAISQNRNSAAGSESEEEMDPSQVLASRVRKQVSGR